MNSLTKNSSINESSSAISPAFTRKRSNDFPQIATMAPAVRSASVATEIDEPLITKVATRIIRSKSENHKPTKTIIAKSLTSASQPMEISAETLEQRKETYEKNMNEMRANSVRAYREHVAKEKTTSTSFFALANDIIDQSDLPPIKIKHYVAERKGIRPRMEDASFFEEIKGGYVAGIFDGHGGSQVAKLASKKFPGLFSKTLKEKNGDVSEAFTTTFEILNLEAVTKKPLKHVGSTAVASYITNCGTVFTATIGDSEAFRYNKDETGKTKSTPLSVVRDWSSQSEAIRAVKLAKSSKEQQVRQAWVGAPDSKKLRVSNPSGMTLNLSRAVGDITYNAVSQNPVITVDQIREKAIIGYMCDGVTDFVSQQEIIDLTTSKGKLSEKIANYALETGGSTDNVTAMVLMIKRD